MKLVNVGKSREKFIVLIKGQWFCFFFPQVNSLQIAETLINYFSFYASKLIALKLEIILGDAIFLMVLPFRFSFKIA
jgi:hypothetical protein